MANRRFQLVQKQVQALAYAYTCGKDDPTRTRYQVIRLYGNGYPVKEVMEITDALADQRLHLYTSAYLFNYFQSFCLVFAWEASQIRWYQL